jgi:hypothetical protein
MIVAHDDGSGIMLQRTTYDFTRMDFDTRDRSLKIRFICQQLMLIIKESHGKHLTLSRPASSARKYSAEAVDKVKQAPVG